MGERWQQARAAVRAGAAAPPRACCQVAVFGHGEGPGGNLKCRIGISRVKTPRAHQRGRSQTTTKM